LPTPQIIAEVHLNTAIGMLMPRATHPQDGAMSRLDRAVRLADELGITKYRIEALVAMGTLKLGMGEYSGALETVEAAVVVARSSADPVAAIVAERLGAQAYHLNGDHERARGLAEKVLASGVAAFPLVYSQIPIDHRVSMRIVLARILWLGGQPDSADRM